MTVAQETVGNFSNASSGFANAGGLVEPFVVVLYVTILIVGVLALRDADRFHRIGRAIHAAIGSVYYAVIGAVTLVGVGALLAPLYVVTQLDAGTKAAIGKWGGIALAGYLILVAIGYVAKRTFEHVRATNPAFDEWVTPDEDADTEVESA